MLATIPLPGHGDNLAPPQPGRELTAYSDAELDGIYDHYDQELAGELRRGAEPRFWEDVAVGDGLGVVLKGPLDTLTMPPSSA